MSEILLYFLKSAVAMALFYLIYRLFMQKETLYSVNRFYLLGTLILSLVIPILPLENLFMVKEKIFTPTFYINLEGPDVTTAVVSSGESGFSISAFILLQWIYIGGVVVLFGGFIFELIRLQLLPKVHKQAFGPMKVIFVNKDIIPFSWFNLVFMDQSSREDPQIGTIIQHEYAHYKNLHFLDLLILEVITIFQWFNPLVWLYVRSIKEIHEYQADAAVLTRGQDTGRYQALLVNQLTGAEVFRLSNAFSKSLTKKRMIMMTKMKSKRSAWLKALIAMPALAILLMAFSSRPTVTLSGEPIVVEGKVMEAEGQSPMPGVSIVVKGGTIGTVTDRDGNFMLKLDEPDLKLAFSFVGYKTVVMPVTTEFMNVELERGPITLNPWKKEAPPPPPPPPSPAGAVKAKAIQGQIGDKGEKQKQKSKEGEEQEIFFIVEDLAHFPGGMEGLREYLTENIKYPADATEGTSKILVGFTITTDGSVVDVKMEKGTSKAMDKEAYRLVSEMPKWEPAKQRSKPVRSDYILPVVFTKQF